MLILIQESKGGHVEYSRVREVPQFINEGERLVEVQDRVLTPQFLEALRNNQHNMVRPFVSSWGADISSTIPRQKVKEGV
jgi:hypothetical protein